MSTETVDYIEDSSNPKRPTFLTVLCIITFVVSGYNLIMAVVGIFSSRTFDEGQMQEGMAKMRDAMAEADPQTQKFLVKIMESMQDMIQTGIAHATTLGIGEILAAALSVLGAILMFKLRKSGYYTYIIAKIIGVAVPFAIFGFNMLTGIFYGFVALIGIIFIILYNLNRKALH